jgi:hypothetical protein
MILTFQTLTILGKECPGRREYFFLSSPMTSLSPFEISVDFVAWQGLAVDQDLTLSFNFLGTVDGCEHVGRK